MVIGVITSKVYFQSAKENFHVLQYVYQSP